MTGDEAREYTESERGKREQMNEQCEREGKQRNCAGKQMR